MQLVIKTEYKTYFLFKWNHKDNANKINSINERNRAKDWIYFWINLKTRWTSNHALRSLHIKSATTVTDGMIYMLNSLFRTPANESYNTDRRLSFLRIIFPDVEVCMNFHSHRLWISPLLFVKLWNYPLGSSRLHHYRHLLQLSQALQQRDVRVLVASIESHWKIREQEYWNLANLMVGIAQVCETYLLFRLELNLHLQQRYVALRYLAAPRSYFFILKEPFSSIARETFSIKTVCKRYCWHWQVSFQMFQRGYF